MSIDHIIHNSATQLMECQHCGFTQALKMPAPIDGILTEMDAFMEAHEGCTRPQNETVMSEYIQGFDAGYEFVLQEIGRYIKVCPEERITLHLEALLKYLRIESTKGRETT